MRTRESEVVQRAMAGDSSAMSWLVARYRTAVYSYVQKRIEDADVAQDLTQDVFIRALGAIRGLKSHEAFRKWLYAIASRVTMDFVRRREIAKSRGTFVPEEELEALPVVDPEEPIDVAVRDENLHGKQRIYAWLITAVCELPRVERDVMLLRYVTELSYRDLAELCDLSLGATKQRIYRAHLRLRERLGSRRRLSHVAEGSHRPSRLRRRRTRRASGSRNEIRDTECGTPVPSREGVSKD